MATVSVLRAVVRKLASAPLFSERFFPWHSSMPQDPYIAAIFGMCMWGERLSNIPWHNSWRYVHLTKCLPDTKHKQNQTVANRVTMLQRTPFDALWHLNKASWVLIGGPYRTCASSFEPIVYRGSVTWSPLRFKCKTKLKVLEQGPCRYTEFNFIIYSSEWRERENLAYVFKFERCCCIFLSQKIKKN